MKKIKKLILLALLCVGMVMTVVGCSNNKDSAVDKDIQTPSPTTDESKTEISETDESKTEENTTEEANAPRIVNTVMGDIEIPANPQRVVVNWYIGDVLALDLNVVGYFCWAHEAMPFYDQMMETVAIENWEPEEVMKLEPDLIITYSEDDFNTFNKIAPVLVIPEGNGNSLERVQLIAEATGRTEQAQTAVTNFETKLAVAKEKLQSDTYKDKSFSITEDWGSGSYGVYYETGSRGGTLVYEYLGLKKPEALEQLIEETGEGRGGLSYEVAAEYFGDYMIWFRPYDAVEDVPTEYESTEIWNSIPAVKEGQVVTIPGAMSGLFYYSDVMSLTAQLDYMVEAIVATEK